MKSKTKVQFKMPPVGARYAGSPARGATTPNPVTRDQTVDAAKQIIDKSQMPPEMWVEIGSLANAAIKDKKQYPAYVEYMVSKGLETKESMKKPNYQLMAMFVVVGRVAQTMVDQGM